MSEALWITLPKRSFMQYWLLKSEPSNYSIERLKQERRTEWSGVRNYQARNFMKSMSIGDLAFFYHSNTQPIGIAGICQVACAAYPDFTALDSTSEYFDPRATPERPIWEMVDIAFIESFPRVIPLDELRGISELSEMPLLQRGQRLSVQPVTCEEWHAIIENALKTSATFAERDGIEPVT